MLFLTLWLLVLILERSIASNQRSVNLALETVLQFDKPDDINLINKVQDFLSHMQSLLDKKSQLSYNVNTRRKIKYKFTDFVEDLITTVNSFEDNDLKHFFRILEKDFRTRRVDNDLIDNNVRRFLSRKLTKIKNQPATNIRRDLDRILRELRADENNKSSFFLDFINSLYKQDSERKLSKLIKRLNLFNRSTRKSKFVLKNIIEKVVNDVIFEHYNNLEDNEKDYIKKFAKTHIIDDLHLSTANNLKIEQRAKEPEITQESINTNENTDESKPAKQPTTFQLTPKTYKNVPKESKKKIITHITLYPQPIRVKKMPTSFPSLYNMEMTPANDENSKDKKIQEEIKETNHIFTNQSVEINVNLLLKHSGDSLDREDSEMVESFKFNHTPKKVFPRALKKSMIDTKYRKSSLPAFSIETFGNLYRRKTPKIYHKETSRLVTYNDKTTMEDPYFKSINVNDIVKENSVPEKKYFDVYRRRFNKQISLNDNKVPQSVVKDIFETTKLHSFTKRALVPLIISTDKVTTPELNTDKSTTQTSQIEVLNEILDNENLTDFKEVNNKPQTKKITTNIEFVQKNKTTPIENDSSNNMTTVTEVSIAFNINNYIKNSELLNLEDKEKKKKLEEKMRADFGTLLDTPPSNATTEGFTDIFKELEDAFEI